MILDRRQLERDTLEAGPRLLGARLVRGRGPAARVGRIVEVEAYIGRSDLASHAHPGRTPRNRTMFGMPGRAYVYLTYGMHHCLNVVTEADGTPAALLVRAVEPVAGIEAMRAARFAWVDSRLGTRGDGRLGTARQRILALGDELLASGPGLICQAFSITRADDGVDLCDPASDLRLEFEPGDGPAAFETGPRIGMGTVPEPWHSIAWRFHISGNPAVSHRRRRLPGDLGRS